MAGLTQAGARAAAARARVSSRRARRGLQAATRAARCVAHVRRSYGTSDAWQQARCCLLAPSTALLAGAMRRVACVALHIAPLRCKAVTRQQAARASARPSPGPAPACGGRQRRTARQVGTLAQTAMGSMRKPPSPWQNQ